MKSVLITGGSSGIGAAVAKEAATRGWTVFIGYSTGKDRADKIEKDIRAVKGTAHSVKLVLGEPDTISAAVKFVQDKGGRLDALVLSAAPAPKLESFAKSGAEEFKKQLDVNVLANYDLLVQVWNGFFKKEQKGHVLAVLSAAMGPPPWAGMAPYIVGKRALQALLECAVSDLGPRGLRATFISPDYTETPMLMDQEPLIVEMAREKQKNQRFLRPAEVARLIVDRLEKDHEGELVSSFSISG